MNNGPKNKGSIKTHDCQLFLLAISFLVQFCFSIIEENKRFVSRFPIITLTKSLLQNITICASYGTVLRFSVLVAVESHITKVHHSQGRHGEFEPGKAQYSTPNCFDQLFLIRVYWNPKSRQAPGLRGLASRGNPEFLWKDLVRPKRFVR